MHLTVFASKLKFDHHFLSNQFRKSTSKNHDSSSSFDSLDRVFDIAAFHHIDRADHFLFIL